MPNLLIQNGRVIDPSQQMDRVTNVLVENGKISGYDFAPGRQDRVLDAAGKTVREAAKTSAGGQAADTLFFAGKAMSLKTPVVVGGSKIGEVVIDYSSKTINRNLMESIVTVSLYQLIMLLVVGLVMVLLFNKDIKKPVSRINKAIERITMGELSTDVPDLGENEIGSIAKGIAFLSERLSTTLAKLHATAVNVSMAIKQVDVTYNNVITSTSRQSKPVVNISTLTATIG
jgi:methyl-accepting chemotaxis protein